ncbi:hypothetical protein [Sinomicrobium weinanense]|uniref:Uncharacterized protein n=1 Tax=Sinomicrobium weinanense TaxID=2842200 RepID=A0A926JQ00_9FLAO|nr:hypothetical protein [Sinomicrobium weinanense]MBC9795241.1 hypothetical protein [Sinomicrobium weinanense]MBU3122018.1 hypothetical protein [Sinomicrobium weinanense]
MDINVRSIEDALGWTEDLARIGIEVDELNFIFQNHTVNTRSLVGPGKEVKQMSDGPPVKGLDWYRDDTGEYFWNAEKDLYEHYTYNNDGSTNFNGYYDASEFNEPNGDFAIIFDLSNAELPDEFDQDHTISSLATPLMQYLSLRGEVKIISDQEKYPGVRIYSSEHMNGAVTLGNVIFTNPGMEGPSTLDHEYGHYLDFKHHFNYDKSAYIKEIGLKSFYSATRATIDRTRDHHSSETEKRADILGGAWTGNKRLYSPNK